MRHYLVSWTNWNGEYGSLIIYAKDKAQAKSLVNASYVHAHKIKAREFAEEAGVHHGKPGYSNPVSPKPTLNPRAPQKVIDGLEEALRVAKMETACFGMPGDRVRVVNASSMPARTQDLDTFLKEGTRLYRESWLIPEIEEVLAWARGETS
jgi:hypothetical protein